jgi:hypothetical protein
MTAVQQLRGVLERRELSRVGTRTWSGFPAGDRAGEDRGAAAVGRARNRAPEGSPRSLFAERETRTAAAGHRLLLAGRDASELLDRNAGRGPR